MHDVEALQMRMANDSLTAAIAIAQPLGVRPVGALSIRGALGDGQLAEFLAQEIDAPAHQSYSARCTELSIQYIIQPHAKNPVVKHSSPTPILCQFFTASRSFGASMVMWNFHPREHLGALVDAASKHRIPPAVFGLVRHNNRVAARIPRLSGCRDQNELAEVSWLEFFDRIPLQFISVVMLMLFHGNSWVVEVTSHR
jgi:hypothetical protein